MLTSFEDYHSQDLLSDLFLQTQVCLEICREIHSLATLRATICFEVFILRVGLIFSTFGFVGQRSS